MDGYNPMIWKIPDNKDNDEDNGGEWCKIKDSFIFSFKNKDHFFKDAVISNVENIDRAIYYRNCCGPCFGDDIEMFVISKILQIMMLSAVRDGIMKKE